MNHKRGKPKASRAGCLMCKPNKMSHWAKHAHLGHAGFGNIRSEAGAREALKEVIE